MTTSERLMDIAERLSELEPAGTYARRGASLIANLMGAAAFRLERAGYEPIASEFAPTPSEPTISLPLRQGRSNVGTLHLQMGGGAPAGSQLELLKWASRVFARGLDYAERLADDGVLKPDEALAQTLHRAPLTPRERDVVSLLVSGSSTRDIASRTGLTVSTVNTYLKRIFSKLGVHSRVELVARMAGTASYSPRVRYESSHAD